MGRPPSNGGPAFRFNAAEVSEMETILQDHHNMMPAQEVLVAIADKFSNSPERQGKFVVQTKQIWNWFQNKRYAIRARSSKIPTQFTASTMQSMSTGAPLHYAPTVSTMPAGKASAAVPIAPSAPSIPKEDNRLPHSVTESPGRTSSDNTPMEFESRSARDGAWYDVASFLSLKNLETGSPEVLVRFAGFGPEEDEWINVTTHVRHRSLPCESSECVAVLPGDLILCFQEGKDQALYFDAHVLDAQRRRHDARGCRCRFLVRYDHDQSEEIVPLRKICRRPETDYRLQQLHAMTESSAPAKEQQKIVPSTEQIKNDVDSPVQKPPEQVLLLNPSSTPEEQKDAIDCSTEKTTGGLNAAPSNTQHSHPEMINLDPETEVENNSYDVKGATDDMAVDEQLEKPTDIATTETCLTVEKTDDMPVCGIDATFTQNVTEDIQNEASPTAGTEHGPKYGDVNTQQMIVETNSTTDDGKADTGQGKDDPISSTDAYSLPEMTSSVDNITLEQEVPETGSATEGKLDVSTGKGIVTLTSTRDDADHPVK
ncbi:unnamed protein product [Rhodiola kirilowii]